MTWQARLATRHHPSPSLAPDDVAGSAGDSFATSYRASREKAGLTPADDADEDGAAEGGSAAAEEDSRYSTTAALAPWLRPALVSGAEARVSAMLETGIDQWAAPGFDALQL
jgi:hypothetical protein